MIVGFPSDPHDYSSRIFLSPCSRGKGGCRKCEPRFRSMKITEDKSKYERPAEDEAIAKAMAEKSKDFAPAGAEICAKT